MEYNTRANLQKVKLGLLGKSSSANQQYAADSDLIINDFSNVFLVFRERKNGKFYGWREVDG